MSDRTLGQGIILATFVVCPSQLLFHFVGPARVTDVLKNSYLWRARALLRGEAILVINGSRLRRGVAALGIVNELNEAGIEGRDLDRVLNVFLDAVIEILHPGALALLLPDETGKVYHVRTRRGPWQVEAAQMSADIGLGWWLGTHGRPAGLKDLAGFAAAELRRSGGVLAVPLLSHGKVVGILIAGERLVGGTYDQDEMDTLFDLARHAATTLESVRLRLRLEQILEHMSNGVVTLGADGRVSRLNRRGAEILGLDPGEVVGEDPRVLPSPLGDMLYETLLTGRARSRIEIRLALRGLWLEVSTYRIREDESMGAVLVYEDRTAQKELTAQKRESEQFELLTRMVAHVADEIKDPVESITNIAETIDERYDDIEFRESLASTMRLNARRLMQVFATLAGLVSKGEPAFSIVDVNKIVDEVTRAMRLSDQSSDNPLHLNILSRESAPQLVRVDATHLQKSLSYLIRYFVHKSYPADAQVSVSVERRQGNVHILIRSRTARVPPDRAGRLFDPHMTQENPIELGPVVSQRLIEGIGGRLRIHAHLGEWEFDVSLPIVNVA